MTLDSNLQKFHLEDIQEDISAIDKVEELKDFSLDCNCS